MEIDSTRTGLLTVLFALCIVGVLEGVRMTHYIGANYPGRESYNVPKIFMNVDSINFHKYNDSHSYKH